MRSPEACTPARTKVLLLKGGSSGERGISLISAEAVAKALRAEGFRVVEVDTGADGYLHVIMESDADVVYICLHGKYGEDGTVQGLCELLGKPYVGPGVLASALAMDKARSKVFYSANGLNTPHSVNLGRGEAYSVQAIIDEVGDKCVVKPATEGSALGVSIVHGRNELAAAIEAALAIDDVAIVETFIKGTEVTVGVLGNKDPQALPVIEILPGNEFYDFDAKYRKGGSKHICPAFLSPEVTAECQRMAVKAHEALGCKGVSRSDIIVDEQDVCWLLETNTIPGMTPTSLLPDAARVAGMDFQALCRHLIELALEEHRGRMDGRASIMP